MSCDSISGETVSLEEILEAREARVRRQGLVLARFALPIVSITLVMPGPVKDHDLSRFVADEGFRAVDDLLQSRGWPILWHEEMAANTGAEALYAVQVDGLTLKSAMAELEDRHPLGRLWDIDVIDPERGAISRSALAIAARRCLVCDEPGHACSRSRRHALPDLLTAIRERVHDYRASS